ncbi:MAG: Trp family transcriptional regulator [Kiritimatiellia bacterium]|nr:trp operon repressor [Lentisphaerota bacterium]
MKRDSIDEIARVLAGLSRPAEVRAWLQALLTPRERVRLLRRWQLVRLLDAGLSQREIARRLGLSLCNITRGSRELRRGSVLFSRIVAQRAKPVLKSKPKEE